MLQLRLPACSSSIVATMARQALSELGNQAQTPATPSLLYALAKPCRTTHIMP